MLWCLYVTGCFVLLVVSLCDRMFCALVSLCDRTFCALGGVFM